MSESIDRHGEARMDAIDGLVTGEMSRDDFIEARRPGFLGQRDRRILAAAGRQMPPPA